jgi:hypothetical protein
MSNDQDITPKILLEHMRGMEHRLVEKLNNTENGIRSDMKEQFNVVNIRLDRLESKVSLIQVQIKNMDERLDDLEVVQVPKIRKSIRRIQQNK